MPLFVDAYDSDTAHLSMEEDGAYSRLLRLCWKSPGCTMPNDPVWIARRLRISDADFERVVRPLIAEFFITENGRIYQKRLLKEFAQAKDARDRKRTAGAIGGKAKALKNNDNGSSSALAENSSLAVAPNPISNSKKDTSLRSVAPSASRAKGTRLSEDWVLPKSFGDWALSQGLPRERILIEAEKMKNWSINAGRVGVKVDWFAAWKNWVQKAIDDLPKKPPAKTNGTTPAKPIEDYAEADWVSWLEYCRPRGEWARWLGPPPFAPGCLVPAHLLVDRDRKLSLQVAT